MDDSLRRRAARRSTSRPLRCTRAMDLADRIQGARSRSAVTSRPSGNFPLEMFEDDIHDVDHKRGGSHDISATDVGPPGAHGGMGRRLLGFGQALCRPMGWSIRSRESPGGPNVTEMVAGVPSGVPLRILARERRSCRTSVDTRSPAVRTTRATPARATALRSDAPTWPCATDSGSIASLHASTATRT
jgi:hypothetical protein